MSQSARLLDYLQRNRTIHPIEAWYELGIYRLGARVWDLKNAGHKIKTEQYRLKNRFGEVCRVARYHLI